MLPADNVSPKETLVVWVSLLYETSGVAAISFEPVETLEERMLRSRVFREIEVVSSTISRLGIVSECYILKRPAIISCSFHRTETRVASRDRAQRFRINIHELLASLKNRIVRTYSMTTVPLYSNVSKLGSRVRW